MMFDLAEAYQGPGEDPISDLSYLYDQTDVGALAVLGAPEDEMDLRVKAAGVH